MGLVAVADRRLPRQLVVEHGLRHNLLARRTAVVEAGVANPEVHRRVRARKRDDKNQANKQKFSLG